MAAKDYVIAEGLANIYFAKKIKSNGRISTDRRVITHDEILTMFKHCLQRYCIENRCAEINVTDKNGALIFSAEIKGALLETVKKSIK